MKSFKIDLEALERQLESERQSRKKTSFYVSEEIYERFKKACGEYPPSRVLELLMKAYVEGKRL